MDVHRTMTSALNRSERAFHARIQRELHTIRTAGVARIRTRASTLHESEQPDTAVHALQKAGCELGLTA